MLGFTITSFRALLLISLCLSARTTILRLPCGTTAEFMVFEIGKRLTGHVIRTDHGLDDVKCMIKCVEHPKCRSYNINLKDSRCELNSKAHADNGTILIAESNWLYKSTDYQDSWVGPTCKQLKPCQSDVLCKDTCEPPYYKCLICDKNHTGLHCDQKIDQNECENNPCLNSGTCIDMFAAYKCNCSDGYMGKNCETDIDECSSLPCFNGGKCINMVNRFQCSCIPGYTGSNCETEFDECSSQPCLNGATCIDKLNSFQCKCVIGYTGTLCNIDINECSSQPCLNGGTCTDKVNGFECSCAPGYTGVKCEKFNKCSSNPCPFGTICNDDIGDDYVCLRNVATGKITSQSTTGHGGVPSKAIDGNKYNIYYSGGFCSHTSRATDRQEWWKVDLVVPHYIQAVKITSRADCCWGWLSNFNITVDEKLCKYFTGTAVIGDNYIPCTTTVVGQSLKIKLTAKATYLILCEVEVYGSAKPVHECSSYPCRSGSSCEVGANNIVCLANVARAKSTIQSSTYFDGISQRAVDGNKDNLYESGSCTHTEGNTHEWWQVDLGAYYAIHSVRITNRGDCCFERLKNFNIKVDNSLCKHFQGTATQGDNFVPCSTVIVGRMVKIQMLQQEILALCEVEVNAIFKVASGQSTSQSTTKHGGVSSRAIDGVKDGNYAHGSCTHTDVASGRHEWWQVDLGVARMISAVSITNRNDCCSNLLSNFKITIDEKICKHFQGTASSGDTYIPCSKVTTGQRIKIELMDANKHLILCEVQVVAALQVN